MYFTKGNILEEGWVSFLACKCIRITCLKKTVIKDGLY